MKFEWIEITDETMPHFYTFRAKIFGGWLVRSSEWTISSEVPLQSEALVFVPDPKHEWVIENDQ